eukprot:TRINITY_DN16579_c0_g1_i1.p1 TRINITY_DN16579_c0_g1~~TRINITY_DN16579_c0_g1_i1.p1  ORF type:complete len:221 (+),score=23.67 TRINITY_DN16579_c0_g1_i1:50-712(+)
MTTSRRVLFYLTGFGRFCGVDENPTTVLINNWPEDAMKGDGFVIEAKSVVEVASTDAHIAITKLLTTYYERKLNKEASDQDIIVWLHFGVHGEETVNRLVLERTAWNEATFRCPDERDWLPFEQPIMPEHLYIDYSYNTKLNLEEISKLLTESQVETRLSTDAGRFLCNYIYYLSLHYSSRLDDVRSLFVHVPKNTIMSAEELQRSAIALLNAISKTLVS